MEDTHWKCFDTAIDGIKPRPPAPKDQIIFRGSCRCKAIQYTSKSPPSDITVCHCRACQQVSGSTYIPWIASRLSAFTYTSSSSLKTIELSDVAKRTFCGSCGTPIAMVYAFDEDEISVSVGSMDMESLKCEMPRVMMHIYLAEKAEWVEVPEDGAERWGTMENAHWLVAKTGSEDE